MDNEEEISEIPEEPEKELRDYIEELWQEETYGSVKGG